jgi:hypothetical protein
MVGVKAKVEALGTIVWPKVRPLNDAVVVLKVMVAPVVVAQPEPRAVKVPAPPEMPSDEVAVRS